MQSHRVSSAHSLDRGQGSGVETRRRSLRRTSGHRTTLAVVCALALVLGACSSSGSDDDVAAGATDDSDAARIEQLIFGDEDATAEDYEQQFAAQEAAAQASIAECMSAAGFEYFPRTSDIAVYEEPEYDYLSREYAETYGFGYSTMLEPGFATVAVDSEDDPNNDYVNSLSEAEQEQYYLTLHGDQSVWETIESDEQLAELQAEQPELFEPTGCEGEAWAASDNGSNEVYETYGDELDQLYESAMNDPAVVSGVSDWAACMAEQGFSVSEPDDLDTIMDPYMEEIWSSAVHPGSSLTDEDYETLSDEELNEIVSQPTTYDEELVAEAQAFEIKIAVAAWDCGMPELYDVYQEAYGGLRRAFVESHLDELAALVDADRS